VRERAGSKRAKHRHMRLHSSYRRDSIPESPKTRKIARNDVIYERRVRVRWSGASNQGAAICLQGDAAPMVELMAFLYGVS
jgi:hypothetical protein